MKSPEPIRFACMNLMWGWRMPQERLGAWLAEVREAGYEGISCFDSDLLRFSTEAELAGRMREHGLGLASVDYFIDRDFDRLRRVCEQMAVLDCRRLVTIGGLAVRGADMREVADLLNQIGGIALEYDILAVFHNHTGHTGETLEETEQLLSLTDPALFFGFLDIGHATKDFVGHPVADRAAIFLERNWDRIRFLEFKDWSPETDLATEVGAGQCNYGKVVEIIKRRGYTGWITVEQNAPTPGKTPFESARSSRDTIRELLEM
jgi:inosose dehydratase